MAILEGKYEEINGKLFFSSTGYPIEACITSIDMDISEAATKIYYQLRESDPEYTIGSGHADPNSIASLFVEWDSQDETEYQKREEYLELARKMAHEQGYTQHKGEDGCVYRQSPKFGSYMLSPDGRVFVRIPDEATERWGLI